MTKELRRGRNIALAGAVGQAGLTLALLLIGVLGGASSPVACAAFLGGGVLVWLMVAVLLYCRELEAQEGVELEELSGRGEQGGVFDRREDLALRPAAARRAFVERWVAPSFTLVLAAYQVAMGLLVLAAARSALRPGAARPITGLAPGLLFAVLAGLVAFLFSRYCTGMSSREVWRPLRAPASCLLVGALAIAAVAVGLLAAWWHWRGVDFAVAIAVGVGQFIFAAELLVGFLLDLYRPRVPGQSRRLAFDSRVFNLLAEPGRIGHSIAETLNYQFGFEVSKTWFYRLLSRSLLPLVIFGAVVLAGLTSVVIVYEGQQSVVLHWGRRDAGRLLGPGCHLKWPWPIDTARHFDVAAVHELLVGAGEARKPVVIKGREIRMWTQSHGRFHELDFLVAIPPERSARSAAATTRPGPAGERPADKRDSPPPPVNVIKLVVSVKYRIADAYKFGYRFVDAAKLLEAAAYREMVRYCASATLHSKVGAGDANRPEAIMTSGWGEASRALERRIRKAAGPEGLDLGVDVATVRLVTVHPPSTVADAYEAVLAAERRQDQLRYEAQGRANRMLSAVAGDSDSALELALAIAQLERWEALSELRSNRVEFDRALSGYVRRAGENIRMLLGEIRRQELLGRLRAPAGAAPAGGLSAAITKRLPQVDAGLRPLLEGIARDARLDRLVHERGTAKQRLAARHVRHLLRLLAVGADPAAADLDAARKLARERADRLFDRATGEPAQKVARANAYRLSREMKERALAESFSRELLAYRASPNMYMLDRWLDAWDDALPGMTKYVLGIDRDNVEIWMNWERHKGSLEGVLGGQGQEE